MTKDREDFEGKLGFDKKTAAEMLHRFIKTKEEIRKHIDDLRATQRDNLTSSERTNLERSISELEQSMATVEKQITTVRDWYGLYVLEGLEKESRRLKWLTAALIGLTAILIIFTGFLVFGIRITL